MYLVPIEVKESVLDGKGVFALENIPQGKIVWEFQEAHDKVLSEAEFELLDDDTKSELKRVAYLSPTSHQYVYPPEEDAARFTNHSPTHNLSVVIDENISKEPYFVSNRDIEAGEELTNNYDEFDDALKSYRPEWLDKT